MAPASAPDPNAEIAQRVQEKFEFYLLALTFTVLGLSVETAEFGEGVASDLGELFGWAFLFASGIVGLSRLEWQPPLFQVFSRRSFHEELISEFKKLVTKGTTEVGVWGEDRRASVAEVLKKHEEAVEAFDRQAEKMESRGLSKYRWQRATLLAGFVFLMIARGLPPLVAIFGYRLR